jgi:hypothetical protein
MVAGVRGAVAERRDPVVVQALANGAKLDRGEFETQFVPNPLGEVEHEASRCGTGRSSACRSMNCCIVGV